MTQINIEEFAGVFGDVFKPLVKETKDMAEEQKVNVVKAHLEHDKETNRLFAVQSFSDDYDGPLSSVIVDHDYDGEPFEVPEDDLEHIVFKLGSKNQAVTMPHDKNGPGPGNAIPWVNCAGGPCRKREPSDQAAD